MVNRKLYSFIAGLFLVCLPGISAMADDTELYTNNTSVTGGDPLVMFTLDYSSSTFASECDATKTDDANISCYNLAKEGYMSHVDNLASVKRNELLAAVFKKVMNGLYDMKIGLMLNHANTCTGAYSSFSSKQCSNGGYVAMGIAPIDAADTNGNKALFYSKLDALPGPGDLSWVSGSGALAATYQPKEMFFEFFRYLTGQAPFSGFLEYEDYNYKDTTNNGVWDNLEDYYPALKRDHLVEGLAVPQYDKVGPAYESPIVDKCSKIFTVNFTFNPPQGGQDDDADTYINATKANGGLEGIGLSAKNKDLTNVLRYLNQVDLADGTWGSVPDLEGVQNVTSFFVVPQNMLSTGNSWAAAGGTTSAYEYVSGVTKDKNGNVVQDGVQKLIDDLTSILKQILSVSTTFTAASVPVSVLNRAQVENNVYIALFKADQNNKKRWPGNVKKLKLDLTNGLLVDATTTPAIASDGRIEHNALTYWTHVTELPNPDTSNGEIAGKDGRAVARGGSGQNVPGFMLTGVANDTGDPGAKNSISGARQLYYQKGGSLMPLNVDPSNTDTTTADDLWSDLGATDPSVDLYKDVNLTLEYIRGYDIFDEDGDTKYNEARNWIVGDPLHSRPLPINYGARGSYTATNPDIRLVFGTNDGFFRMIQNINSDGSESGKENWAFMPREVMNIETKLRNNYAGAHPYGVDGAPSVYYFDKGNDGKIVKADGDKVWVFFGLRRGGRAYYAMDVTDPDSPSFLWKINNNTTGFSELGYTFSQPRVGMLDYGSGAKPVLVFAGGYDKQKDTISAKNDTMGNAIYIVDAASGALVWKAVYGASNKNISTTVYNHNELVDSIPSTMTVSDTDADGLLDRAYVGDTGGRVWRVDFQGNDRQKWYAKKLAELGDVSTAGNDRRFFHRPDFVQYRDGTSDYDAVVISSGNRADPLDSRPVIPGDVTKNFLYVIKDRNIVSGTLTVDPSTDKGILQSDLYDATDNCIQDTGCTVTSTQLKDGWKMQFELSGEKGLATPTTLAKKIFAPTFIPPGSGAGGSCEPNEGSGRLYVVSLDNATAVNDYYAPNGETLAKEDRAYDLKSGGIPAEVVYIPFNRVLTSDLTIQNVGVSGRWKTYWYKKED